MKFSAVVVAAGAGLRAGPGEPKAWRRLGARPILQWSIEALLGAGAEEVVLVVAKDRLDQAWEDFAAFDRCKIVAGGETRADSVKLGLEAIRREDRWPVLVHDAARPFVTAVHVRELLLALGAADGVIPALPVADTLKRGDVAVSATVDRDSLWQAQTPQAFYLGRLKAAYANWPPGDPPTDDAGVLERDGGKVVLTRGDPMLMKLTFPEDFAMAERLAGARRIVRTGFGIDAHRFGPGDSVWLGGVRLPHSQGLIGHSDADVGLHALTDALLGAIAEGDIGQHFPPSDPLWKDASSDRFLAHAADLARARGGEIASADLTFVCESPKIGPHREAMRGRIAEILNIPIDRVSVKATTTEGMGFTGRAEGLMAQAVVSVEVSA